MVSEQPSIPRHLIFLAAHAVQCNPSVLIADQLDERLELPHDMALPAKPNCEGSNCDEKSSQTVPWPWQLHARIISDELGGRDSSRACSIPPILRDLGEDV